MDISEPLGDVFGVSQEKQGSRILEKDKHENLPQVQDKKK